MTNCDTTIEARGIPRKADHPYLPASILKIRAITEGGYMKTCSKCKQDKPVEAFGKSNTSKSGLASHCKACQGLYRKAQTIEYKAWLSMRARCNYGRTDHKDYYDKGIRVCERWNNYQNFLADMGEKPTPRHQIDRIDSDKNYSPDNCRWATPAENERTRGGVKLTMELAREIREFWDDNVSEADIGRFFDISHTTVWQVVNHQIWVEADIGVVPTTEGD